MEFSSKWENNKQLSVTKILFESTVEKVWGILGSKLEIYGR